MARRTQLRPHSHPLYGPNTCWLSPWAPGAQLQDNRTKPLNSFTARDNRENRKIKHSRQMALSSIERKQWRRGWGGSMALWL